MILKHNNRYIDVSAIQYARVTPATANTPVEITMILSGAPRDVSVSGPLAEQIIAILDELEGPFSLSKAMREAMLGSAVDMDSQPQAMSAATPGSADGIRPD